MQLVINLLDITVSLREIFMFDDLNVIGSENHFSSLPFTSAF